MKKTLTFIKRDQYDLPIYQDENGVFWIDIDPRKGHGAIYICRDNNPDNGPDDPMDKNIVCEFVPERIIDPPDKELQIIYFI